MPDPVFQPRNDLFGLVTVNLEFVPVHVHLSPCIPDLLVQVPHPVVIVPQYDQLPLDHGLSRRHLICDNSLHALLPLDGPVTPLLYLKQPLHHLRVVQVLKLHPLMHPGQFIQTHPALVRYHTYTLDHLVVLMVTLVEVVQELQ